MQSAKGRVLSLIGALATAATVYGQQPPDVVTSDAAGNTAMGTDALFQNTPGSVGGMGWDGTASGAFAGGK